ncbi:MAG: hypothetical protein J2P57_17855 [Acidimicrobiaceae bacterium]|nr:hypothetical protein [Acidimicrobiaceae bacterium]
MRHIVEQARRNGPLPYSALGRSRAEPVTGGEAWLCEALDRWWAELGHPDPYLVVEFATSGGDRARSVVNAPTRWRKALRYVLVDQPPLNTVSGLLLESPALALGPVHRDEEGDSDEPPNPIKGVGPLVTALGELPRVGGVGVVVTIGWLSGEPSDRYERTSAGWAEVRVAATAGGQVADLLVPTDEGKAESLDRLTEGRVQKGQRIAVASHARNWLLQALGALDTGRVVVVDTLVPLTQPLGDGAPPLPLDQLALLRRPARPPAPAFSGMQAVEWEAHQ